MKRNESFAGRYEYGVFNISDVDHFFFFSKCMVGDLINVLHGRERKKEEEYLLKDQRVFPFCIIRPGSRAGAGCS